MSAVFARRAVLGLPLRQAIPVTLFGVRRFHATPVSAAFSVRKWFRRAFRRRYHPTDVPQDVTKLTLFNQAMIPEDLRLPTPGDPLNRIGAGALDACVSAVAGGVVGGIVYLTTSVPELSIAAAQGAALAAWVGRDAMSDGGNRSLGKRVFGLELTYWDGTLATWQHALLRNWYFALFAATHLHPFVDMATTLLAVCDVGSFVLTQDARKVGDYMFGVRVVNERPGREERITDAQESEEIRQLRDEIEELAPGTLAAREAGADGADGSHWYETLQRDIEANLASAAVVAKAKGAEPVAASGELGAAPPTVPTDGAMPSFVAAELRGVLPAARAGVPVQFAATGLPTDPRTQPAPQLLVNKPRKT